jgi:hypothetical protein
MKPRTDKLITATEAGEMLGLDGKTVLARRGGTEGLTRVRVGKRGVRFSRLEVHDLVTKLLNQARQQKREEEQRKAEAQRQHKLRLVPPSGDAAERILNTFRKP